MNETMVALISIIGVICVFVLGTVRPYNIGVLGFAFSLIILVYGGIKITSLAMGQMTSALGVTVGVFYVVMPLCGILNMIYTVLNIVDISKNGVITAQEEKEA